MLKFAHFNFNVLDLERSLAFYRTALDLTVRQEKTVNGATLVFLGNDESDFLLELTCLPGRTAAYDLGEGEFHLAFETDCYNALLQRHREMGCICQEPGKEGGFYFIEDPDGYWIEIVPSHK